MENNPYQSPSVTEGRVEYDPLDSILPHIPRLEFQTEITVADQEDALLRTSFRPQVQRPNGFKTVMRYGAWTLIFLLVVAGAAMSLLKDDSPFLILTAVLMVIFSAIFIWARGRILKESLKHNRRGLGPSAGYIDHQHFFIRNDVRAAFVRLNALVIAATNERRVVLCFDPMLNFFVTLPFDAFSDPRTIQMVADDLANARPKAMPKANQRISSIPPADESLFQPGEGALFYFGQVMPQDLEGTKLNADMRRLPWKILVMIVGMFVIIYGLLIAVSGFTWILIPVFVIPPIVFAVVFFRQLRAQRAIGGKDQPLMLSRGWIDQTGVVTITCDHQDASGWAVYDKYQITDRIMLLRWKELNTWATICRSQFAEQSDWEAACELARQKLPEL